LDWPALAAFPGTLVFYMGVKALPRIAAQLIAGGRPPSEPVHTKPDRGPRQCVDRVVQLAVDGPEREQQGERHEDDAERPQGACRTRA